MIADLFFSAIYLICLVITSPLRLLDNAELPAIIDTALHDLSVTLSSFDFILDKNIFLACIIFIFTVETSIITIKSINWVIRKIPTLN